MAAAQGRLSRCSTRCAVHRTLNLIRRRQRAAVVSSCSGLQAPGVLAQHSIAAGQLSVQLLQQEDVQGAGLLLSRAFAGSPEAVRLDEAMSFMQRHAAQAQAQAQQQQLLLGGLTLVARLAPTDPALLPKGKPSRLVGVATLSLGARSPDGSGSLDPAVPADEAYLSNMAVDPKLRRQGIAQAMLAACEDAARAAGQRAIWLHVVAGEAAAQALYAGWAVASQEKPKLGLFGLGGGGKGRPRVLMRRQLES